ncbi:Serine/threonine-protein kinase PknB [Bythopirellula polymerisocia]|uniref:non-specific serine/threonine protein kinase n=2 Tax=Bythopirellula polymerisocia TaxID=2528003 RepID=A0A5C6CIK4_9BACT|nr:Serine/threonine-protein kinase PknB [Bythopirellula polymerisocia]
MPDAAWDDIKQAFNEVISLSEQDRQRFLDELSQKSSKLHQEVVALLSSHEQADKESFLTGLKSERSTALDLEETISLADMQTLEKKEAEDEAPSMSTISNAAPIEEDNYIGEIGEYKLLEQLGRGGMGVVYKAYQEKLRRTVALKVIGSGSLCSPEDIARFHIEAEAAARLNHPGIVPVYDVGQHEGTHYYSMECIEGQSLAKNIGAHNPRLDPRRATQLIEKVCRAVQYAHDRAVIHRDLKPANIMLDKEGQPRLTDFGLAKVLQEEEGLTMTGQVMGTPNYMAPEQAKGQVDRISNRTDVYSLGATLYALLSGAPPFVGKNLMETLRKVESATPEPLSFHGSPVSLDLWTICEKSLAKRPEDRYESAGAMADDLQRYLSGFPITARAVGPWMRTYRWCQRNTLVAALIGAVVGTMLVASIVSISFGIQANASRVTAEHNLVLLERALEEAFVSVSENDLSDEPGTQQVRRKLLTVAERYYDELNATDQISSENVANASYLLGRVQASLNLAKEAEQSFRKAIEIQASIVQKPKSTVDARMALAATYNELAKLGEKAWSVRLDAANEIAQAGLRSWRENSQKCLQYRTEALAMLPNRFDLQRLQANAKMSLGLCHVQLGRVNPTGKNFADAEQLLQESLTTFRELDEQTENDPLMRKDLARSLAALARLRDAEAEPLVISDPDANQKLIRQSLELRSQAAETLVKLPPEAVTAEIQMYLATCYHLCGESHVQLGEIDEAIAAYESNMGVMQRLLMTNPSVFIYREGVARAQFMLSQLLFANKDNQGYDYIVELQYTLVDGLAINSSNQKAADLLFEYTSSLTDSLVQAKLMAEAVFQLQRARDLLSDLQVIGDDRRVIESAIERFDHRIKELQETDLTT